MRDRLPTARVMASYPLDVRFIGQLRGRPLSLRDQLEEYINLDEIKGSSF